MVDSAVEVLTDDARGMILDGEQLAFADTEGSSVIPVRPLSPFTIAKKRAGGFANPALARFKSGNLLSSIHAEYGDLGGKAVADSAYASEQQYGETSNGITPLGPRPFLGISDRSLRQIRTDAERILGEMISSLDNKTIHAEMTVTG